MKKKVLVISASLRPGSNSHALAEQFAEGARQAGHEVELVSLRDKEIRFCRGSTSCQKTGSCVIRDDVAPLLEKLRAAQVVAFATPIYYYELCGQLKTFLDRTEPLYGRERTPSGRCICSVRPLKPRTLCQSVRKAVSRVGSTALKTWNWWAPYLRAACRVRAR